MDPQTTINNPPKKANLDTLTDTERRALQKADGKTYELLKVLIKRFLIYFFCWGLLPYQAATLLFRIFKLKNI